MLDVIISYHRYMVELLLFIIMLNAVLPIFFRQSIEKMIFWTRIGYFAFWMFWSMNIFAGLIVYMFTGRDLTLAVVLMIIVSIIMGAVEAYRAVKSRKLWMQGLDASRFSIGMLVIEIALLVAVSLFALQAH